MKQQLSKNEMSILLYVESKGGKKVPMTPQSVNQNYNFYQRAHKLEKLGYLDIHRRIGKVNKYSLTNSAPTMKTSNDENQLYLQLILSLLLLQQKPVKFWR